MRTILAITGTRSDYGLMSPVYQEIRRHPGLSLHLVVTGMHLLAEFAASLRQIELDRFGELHRMPMLQDGDSGQAMAQGLGVALVGLSERIAAIRPDLLLLQGDRGEMLAGAIAAAHMNVPVVHMSGGDKTGTIDEPIRNAISKFAHVHLTTCSASSANLAALGEDPSRIFEVGEPGLDLIRNMEFIPREQLLRELGLDPGRPVLMVAQHPVTTEVEQAGTQMTETMEALGLLIGEFGMQAVCTYPNSDAGGREMTWVLESYRGRPGVCIVASLGAQRFLSLQRVAAAMVGNSSSGIFEAPSFQLPAINIGSRQHGRTRACNVIDVGHERGRIVAAVRRALADSAFRAALADCVNPYGDGHTAPRTVDILTRLSITPALLSKWIASSEPLLNGHE